MLSFGPVQVFVSDIEKAEKWYSKVLGMKTLQKYPDFKCVLMRFGGVEFDIGTPVPCWGEGWDKVKIGGRTSIFFESSGIEKDWAGLKKKGAKVVEELSKRPWGERKAVFADPDGNEFNLIEA
jgi:catechol 2,3-dioxygenase-like lactoylglutathione lyase family enzyme